VEGEKRKTTGNDIGMIASTYTILSTIASASVMRISIALFQMVQVQEMIGALT
jgi:hypothetical protein